MKKHRNKNGFTLVEIVVAIGLMAMVVLGTTRLMSLQSRSAILVDAKFGQIKLQKDIRDLLLNKVSCLPAILSRTFNPSGITQLKVQTPSGEIITANPGENELSSYGLRIDSFGTFNPSLISTLPSGDKIYVSTIQLKTSSLKEKVDYTEATVGTIYFELQGNEIVACFSPDDPIEMEKVTCQKMGGTYDLATKKCTMKPADETIACPSGQYLEGFDAKGTKICQPLPPPPVVVVGSPAPAPTPTPAVPVATPPPPPPTPKTVWTRYPISPGPAICGLPTPSSQCASIGAVEGQSCTAIGTRCIAPPPASATCMECR